jgi:putative PIN family toxin of toxin-antitoxin system
VIGAVLDANVIVSAFPSRRGAPAELITRWLDREFRVVVSEHILSGVVRAWSRPWFRERISLREIDRALLLLRTQAVVVNPAPGIHGVARDQEDDLVLATAIAGNANFLVTGDRGLRAIGHYGTVILKTPREFIVVLDQAPSLRVQDRSLGSASQSDK